MLESAFRRTARITVCGDRMRSRCMIMDGAEAASLGQVLDLLCSKIAEDERHLGVAFPYVTRPDGRWECMLASKSAGYDGPAWSHGNWFCGFWVGLLVAAYHRSGDSAFLDIACERMRLVAQRASDGNTHDIGFIFWSSALPLHRTTGEAQFASIALEAANRLRGRIVTTPAGAYVSSWGPHSDSRGRASSAIDTMANIPLLYWAAREAADGSFVLSGQAHAEMTERNFVRPDGTLYHAVEYDLTTGARKRGYTFQGYGDESSWSRGTGWAVYGLAATAAATGQRCFLDRAAALAVTWLRQLGDRDCPPWDFSDPSPAPALDSAAGAIMAAALLDLGMLHPEAAERERWTAEGLRLLRGLVRSCLAVEPDHRGLLKHGCYSKPHNIGPDAAVLFGDYYFVEAIGRLLFPNKLSPAHQPVPN
jgi:unsaturated chondroitin disaccharide hydrolase